MIDDYAQQQALTAEIVERLKDILKDDEMAVYSYDPHNDLPRCTVTDKRGDSRVWVWYGDHWGLEPEVELDQ